MADSRFSALSKDPRYRLPSRKEACTAVDARFGSLFTNQDFRKKARVDRYGRKIKASDGQKELEKLYRLDDEKVAGAKNGRSGKIGRDVVGSSEDQSDAEEVIERIHDPARHGGFAELSSSEEETSEDESDEEAELELAEQTAGQEQTEEIPLGDVSRRIAAVNLDWDNIRAVDLMVVAKSFAPQGGTVERVSIYPSEFGRERLEREEIEGPPKEIFASSRNRTGGRTALDDEDEDDDDEFGEFDVDRDEDEAEDEDEDEEDSIDHADRFDSNEGAPSDDESDDEDIRRQLQEDQVDEGEEFDTAKLREYQLERLQYYYAVISCDSEMTAQALYENMDGREYLSTANFFDLRFIPDETSFDDDTPREECTEVPTGYRPNEFKTQALTHSKVRLTWDDDDATRKEVQKRAFSRAEMDANDLRAYIGSDDESSDAGSMTSRKSSTTTAMTPAERRAAKKEARRAKMRAKLGLAPEPNKGSASVAQKGGSVGDMQITFTSGLSGGAAKDGKTQGVFENDARESSTREQYIQKERERKSKRKEKLRAAREGKSISAAADLDARGEENNESRDEDNETRPVEDPGFDDPFFDDPVAAMAKAKKAARKASQLTTANERARSDEQARAQRAELALLMTGDAKADDGAPDHDDDGMRHFDLRAEARASREAKRAARHRDRRHKDAAVAAAVGEGEGEGERKGEDDVDGGVLARAQKEAGEEQGGRSGNDDGGERSERPFRIEAHDPRFAALFASHEFAIDPSNPRFKATEGMKTLLEEGRRKRKHGGGSEEEDDHQISAKRSRRKRDANADARASEGGGKTGRDEMAGLVARIKQRG